MLNAQKGLKSAQAAPFTKRYGLSLDRSTIDYAHDSDYSMMFADPTGAFEIEGVGADTQAGGLGVLTVGAEGVNPLKKTLTFNLAANGSLGAGGAAGSQTFFIADRQYIIWGINEIHKTAGNDAGAVTLAIFRDTGTQAPGGGTSVMSGTFNLKGTANTLQTATLVNTPSAGIGDLPTSGEANFPILLNTGDRLSAVFTGVLTTLAGVVVTVAVTPGNCGHQAVYFVKNNADLSTQTFYIANRHGCTITGVQAIWQTPFAAAVTVDITKDTGTNAPGAGTSILTAAMDGTTAANTVVAPALTATAATLKMAAGDRLAVKYSATTTGVGVCIVVTMTPIFASRKEITYQLGPNAQQQVAQCFFIADREYEVLELSEVHATAAGGVATIKITIDRGTTAPGGGTAFQNNAGSLSFDMNGTANTVQFNDSTNGVGPIAGTPLHLRFLAAGDRLGINIASGAAQALANVCVTVSLKAA